MPIMMMMMMMAGWQAGRRVLYVCGRRCMCGGGQWPVMGGIREEYIVHKPRCGAYCGPLGTAKPGLSAALHHS